MPNLYADDMLIVNDGTIPVWQPSLYKVLPVSVFKAECPPWNSYDLLRTNCKNCGAPLPKHGRCMYCDTENGMIVKEEKNLRSSTGSLRSSMSITAEGITVTCSEVMDEPFKQAIAIRDEKGKLYRGEVDLR